MSGEQPELTLEELPDLRRKTEEVAKYLQTQLSQHLHLLGPLLAPTRFLGKYAGGKVEVPEADRILIKLEQQFAGYSKRPFDLPRELDHQWLNLVGNRLELYPWEYIHEAKKDEALKPIRITAPLRWILAYPSQYTPTQFARILAGQDQGRPEHIRQFVLNALTLQQAIQQTKGLPELLLDLRYELKVESPAALHNLPAVTVASKLPSFRPEDALILAATAFSGVMAFIELIDVRALREMSDPLTQRIQEIIR